MKLKLIGTIAVFAAFVALDAYAVYLDGYMGVIRQAVSSVGAIAVSVDLVIALTMVVIWMSEDAKQRGVSSLPYLIVTLFLGSVGPLLYLIRRFSSESESERIRAAAPARS